MDFGSWGFAATYLIVLSPLVPGKKIYTTSINNSSALGAASTIWDKAFQNHTLTDLGLKKIHPIS